MSASAISSIEALPLRLPLKKPVPMASGTVHHAETMLIRMEASNGAVGWGEASAAPTMTGETLESMCGAVRRILAPALLGADPHGRGLLRGRIDRAMHANSAAKAAVEIALNDLVARDLGVSLTELYGGIARTALTPMYLIGGASVEDVVEQARECVAAGFGFIKLKCGARPTDEDIAAARAVRSLVGPGVRLCADANMGMAYRDAVSYGRAISELDFEFFEQPLGAYDIKGLASLARTVAVPIAGDECLGTLNDILAYQSAGAIAGANLKTIKCGGMSATRGIADICDALGLKIKLACKVAETSIGAAALTHLGYTIANLDWGISLSNVYLADDIATSPLLPRQGTISRPTGPGLGIEVDEDAVRRHRVGLD